MTFRRPARTIGFVRRKTQVLVVVAVLLLGAAGGALASGSPVKARFTNYGFSLRYPGAWTRVNWCWVGIHVMPIAVLTSAQQAPTCTPPVVGVGASFPPDEALGVGEMSLYLSESSYPRPPGSKPSWNARIGGRPTRLSPPVYGDKTDTAVTCPADARREFRYAAVEEPHGAGAVINVEAMMCGQGLASENAQFRQVLSSIRFTR